LQFLSSINLKGNVYKNNPRNTEDQQKEISHATSTKADKIQKLTQSLTTLREAILQAHSCHMHHLNYNPGISETPAHSLAVNARAVAEKCSSSSMALPGLIYG
jgi:hypothetical protein